jgi:hypothetical protein
MSYRTTICNEWIIHNRKIVIIVLERTIVHSQTMHLDQRNNRNHSLVKYCWWEEVES